MGSFQMGFGLGRQFVGYGQYELRALIGPSTGLAQQAGFQTGDELIAVDAKPVQAWNDALPALALAAMDRRPIDVQVTTLSGHSESRRLALDALPEGQRGIFVGGGSTFVDAEPSADHRGFDQVAPLSIWNRENRRLFHPSAGYGHFLAVGVIPAGQEGDFQ